MNDLDRCLFDIYGKNAAGRWEKRAPFGIVDAEWVNAWENGAQQDEPRQEQPGTESPKPATFPLYTDADMEALPDPVWLIPGFLVAATLSPIYGPPSSYKSFLALHAALCLETGHEWFGQPVAQCDTLYIAAEGAAGMKLSLAAWKTRYGISELPGFRVVPCAVNLMDAAEARRLILTVTEATKADGFNPKLVVVDTLHRSMPGADENSSQHMGIAIANCALIQAELVCAMMPVHHCGKDTERGMRGSNSVQGASDGVNRVDRTGNRVSVTTEKMKDAEDGQVLNLRAVKVDLPPAVGSLKPRDSLVLVLDKEPPPAKAAKADAKVSAKETTALRCLDKAMKANATVQPVLENGAEGQAVREGDWRKWFYLDDDNRDVKQAIKRQGFDRAAKGLLAKDRIGRQGDWVWPKGKSL